MTDIITKYLRFRFDSLSPSGKTFIASVYWSQNTDLMLGLISWHAHWRRYTFAPMGATIFDANCLKDIAEFLEVATQCKAWPSTQITMAATSDPRTRALLIKTRSAYEHLLKSISDQG